MGITSKFHALFYRPLCRAYARRKIGDKPADLVMRLLCSLDFMQVHGYCPHLNNPRTFEEKLTCRMLFDRDPRWTMISDKLHVRAYVESKIGKDYLIPILWNGVNPEEIPYDDLPSKFVIKANHGCGYNIIVKDKTKLDMMDSMQKLKKWLGENFCTEKYLGTAWAYKNIKPAIIVESFIEDNGEVPTDYKFFCFSGHAEFVQMNFDRFGDPYEKTFDRDFNPLDLWQGTKQYPGTVPRPVNYSELINIAENLAQSFNFIRVDLYNVNNKIFFGELTCYPGGGNVKWIPRKYDFRLGEMWK